MPNATAFTTARIQADVDAQFIARLSHLPVADVRDLTLLYAQRVGLNTSDREALIARAVRAAEEVQG